MPFGGPKEKPSLGELEEEKESVHIEEEITNSQAEIAAKKAVIRQLEAENGPGWRKILNVKSWMDSSTLRSFLRGAQKGMKMEVSKSKFGAASQSSPLVELTKKGWGGGIHKA